MAQEKIFAIIVIFLIVGPTCIALSVNSDYYEALADINAKTAANILVDGYNIGNFQTNEVLTQRYFIHGMEKQYDIAVFGSSRAMQMYTLNFPSMSLVNHAISAGRIEDTIAYTQMYIENEKLPKIVIIGVDVWTTQNGHPHNGLEEVYMRGMEKLNPFPHPITSSEKSVVDIFQKLNYIRQILSIPNVRALIFDDFTYYPTDERKRVHSSTIKLVDGWAYPVGIEKDLDEKVKNRALASYRFPELFQPEEAKKFEAYLQRLHGLNVTPILFCAPYHPTVYSGFMNISEYLNILTGITTYLHELSNENKILLIGAYDPSTYNLTDTDFYDGHHPTPQAVAKIIFAHSHELYDLLYTDIYPTYEEYATALAESQAELLS